MKADYISIVIVYDEIIQLSRAPNAMSDFETAAGLVCVQNSSVRRRKCFHLNRHRPATASIFFSLLTFSFLSFLFARIQHLHYTEKKRE